MVFSFYIIFNLLLFNLNNFIFADSFEMTPNNEIKASIENEFKQKYLDSLNSVKSEYGLQEEENFENAQLSSGVAYYKISDDANKSDLVFAGYLFSIKINDRDAGTIYSNNDSGSWQIFNITNKVNFEQSLIAAESALIKGENVKLVSDTRYGIDALYIEGETGERILDLNSDNSNFQKSTENNTISKSTFDEKIKNIKEERAATPNEEGVIQMGSSQVGFTKSEDTSNNLPLILFISGIIVFLPILFILKKKNNN